MRFAQEANDPANAGLSIIRDMLHPVQVSNPELSSADLWTAAGAAAVNFCGGPEIKHAYGRVDFDDESSCPPNGLIPDAAQGADHLREMFYRMGFDDQEIVALSGAHTLGRCHMTRSGYDGPWTHSPLNFNNEYFKNLMDLEWQERGGEWEGPLQYEDVKTQKLMLLPTDMAIRTDPIFASYARAYADDQDLFFEDFAAAYSKLLACGAPTLPGPTDNMHSKREKDVYEAGVHFREHSMHGSLEKVQQYRREGAEVNGADGTGRTAMHKAAFWGHIHVIEYLLGSARDGGCEAQPNVVDFNGDTPLHDAARFAHESVVKALIAAKGIDLSIQNNDGLSPLEVALEYATTSTANKHDSVITMLQEAERNKPRQRGVCPFRSKL